MSVEPAMSQPRDQTPTKATRVLTSRESNERQAWSESPSDRTQLLPEAIRCSSESCVNEMVNDDKSGTTTSSSLPSHEATNSHDSEHILPNEATRENEYEVNFKPNRRVPDLSNGNVKPSTNSFERNRHDLPLEKEKITKDSKNYLDLIDDSKFLPAPVIQDGDSKEAVQLDEFASASDLSTGPTSTKGFWTSIKAVSRLKSGVKLREKNKRKNKKVSTQRVDSFLEKFTTRRGDLTNYPDDEKAKSEVVEDDDKDEDEQTKIIVSPDSDFLIYWLTIVSIAVMYNFWVLIAREAWPELQEKGRIAWFVIDYFCDFIYILDIVVQARTAYLEQGLLVLDSRRLLRHYVRSWQFIIDILSLLPTDLFYLLDTSRLHPIVRCPRFLRIYRFHFWYMKVETRTQFPNTFRVINLTHVLLLLLHWAGAAYFLICEAIGLTSESDEWVYAGPAGRNATLPHKYLASFYWSTLTLTTIGDLPAPDNEIEYFVQIVGYLVGIFIFATIVGQVGAVIENRNATRMEFERHVDHAKRYMQTNNVPRDVQLRILRWYDYTWTRGATQGRGDVNSLGLLPDKHRTELALHVNLQTLKRVSILEVCPPEFLHDLVLKMHLCIFTPGDLVCRKGEVAREMFIISDGLLEVIDESGRVLATLKSGDYFGEIGILDLEGTSNRRMADVLSVGYSELFSLSKDDVLGVLKDYPSVKTVIEDEARRRLKTQKMNKEESDDHNNVDATDVDKDIDRVSILSELSSFNVPQENRKDSTKKVTGQESQQTRRNRESITSLNVPVVKKRRASVYAGPPDVAIKEIMAMVEKVVSEKLNSFAENARLLRETNMDMREKVRSLQKENDTKTTKIQALEKRVKELEN
ncbi:cyclic nucleotide-gated cation channel alpha-3-like isoform X2 [Lytechinus pictus]|uniref:cyclic nucleotide-gated cation channel alpha-3-like isoform X2 n=1 Tax=Lytechinus pictus TaxID=7653 RepID=UPI0030BA02E4